MLCYLSIAVSDNYLKTDVKPQSGEMTVNKARGLHQVADEFSAQTPNLFACFNRG